MTYQTLFLEANERVPGNEANEALWNSRSSLEAEFGRAVVYEVVIDDRIDWGEWLNTTLPKMTEHLRAKGFGLLGQAGVMVAVWSQDTVHLFGIDKFWNAIMRIEGWSEERLKNEVMERRRTAGLT